MKIDGVLRTLLEMGLSGKSKRDARSVLRMLRVALLELFRMETLDAHLRWYKDARLNSDLGYKGLMQYWGDLGLIA